MHRRTTAALLLALVLGQPAPAWAQGNGNGNASGPGSSSGQDNGNGQGNGKGNNGNDNGQGNGNGQAKGNNGAANPISNGNGNPLSTPPSEADQGAELSQDDILAAVESGSAVSLETILPDVRTRTGGEVIDAKLQRMQNFLIYAVTVLTPAGKVMTEYYYARSGIHVEGR